MSHRGTAQLVLCVGALAGSFGTSHASATKIRPDMRSVVMCVYELAQSQFGVLSVDVYAVGDEKYIVDYKFRKDGRTFTGGVGIGDEVVDGKRMYTNETPRGQPDNDGLVELDFLGKTIYEMYENCNLMPGFDDRIRTGPEPQRQKIDVSGKSN